MQPHMKRMVIKSATYRCLSYVVTAVAVYYVTRKPHVAAAIGLADSAGKFCLYLIHEVIWRRIP